MPETLINEYGYLQLNAMSGYAAGGERKICNPDTLTNLPEGARAPLINADARLAADGHLPGCPHASTVHGARRDGSFHTGITPDIVELRDTTQYYSHSL
jgi:hypothetical protein